jgi:hypothetical protein
MQPLNSNVASGAFGHKQAKQQNNHLNRHQTTIKQPLNNSKQTMAAEKIAALRSVASTTV